MRAMVFAGLLSVCALAYSVPSDDADLDALSTADKATAATERASDWKALLESAFGDNYQRYGLPTVRSERLSFDLTLDKTLAPGWRLVFADRLDWNWQEQSPSEYKINTLKELYLSRQITPGEIVDFGRINTHYGVATGYNPTDYFRDDAIRSVVSLDPNSLRNNRLGSVMLRSQILWTGGSLTALVSPKLASQPSDAAFSVDLGSTNNMNRYMFAWSQQVSESVNPQFLLYGEAGKSPQTGFNLTHLQNDATMTYIEWSGGKSASLYSQALGGPERNVFRNRLAAGLTYTTANNISLTLEAEYNGAALDSADWAALGNGSPAAYQQYRNVAQQALDLPTRESLFALVRWPDALVTHLDLSAFARQDMVDQSRLNWAEARYHWEHVDLALQWQCNGGRAMSEWGVLQQRTIWQTVLAYYF